MEEHHEAYSNMSSVLKTIDVPDELDWRDYGKAYYFALFIIFTTRALNAQILKLAKIVSCAVRTFHCHHFKKKGIICKLLSTDSIN